MVSDKVVTKRGVRGNGTLRYERHTVHVRRFPLMHAMPMDRRTFSHHPIHNIHDDRIAQTNLFGCGQQWLSERNACVKHLPESVVQASFYL